MSLHYGLLLFLVIMESSDTIYVIGGEEDTQRIFINFRQICNIQHKSFYIISVNAVLSRDFFSACERSLQKIHRK